MEREKIGTLIKRVREKLGYTQQQLSKAVGVSHVTISQWESGVTSPKAKYIPALAKALRMSVDDLMGIDGNTEAGPDIRGEVPLISWVQAGAWLQMEVRESGVHEMQQTTAKVGPRTFALRVIGDSMTAPYGRSIPDGSIVIVDPDVAPSHGSVVVARLDDSHEATMKQLAIDGGIKYLKPLNPTYPTMQINGNCTIIGVVKQVIQDF